MRARDILEPAPVVRRDASVLDAARLVAEVRAPGVVVLDGDAVVAVLPASQVMRLFVPKYVRDDPALARMWDESHADRLAAELDSTTVGGALNDELPPPPLLRPDDTLIEAAVAMGRNRTPLIPVVSEGRVLGVVTAQGVLAAVLRV